MTKLKSNRFPYSRFDRFCIRTPTLPLEFYFSLTAGKRISDDFLKLQWENILIKEAIFLASPEFYEQLDIYIKDQQKDIIKWKKIKQTFTKYLIRMSTRSTPFGLFAGCTIGEFGKSNNIKLAKIDKGKRVTYLDMHFLVRFADELKKEQRIRDKLVFKPNSSLYRVGDWYRYTQYSYEENRRIHTLESIRHSRYLEIILCSSKTGKTISQLVSQLQGMPITEIEAKTLVNDIIEHQLLVSNIEVRVSGQDYLEVLIFELKRIGAPTNDINLCIYLKNYISNIDENIGQSKYIYENFTDFILDEGIPYDKRYLFQTDLYPKLYTSNLSNGLDRKIKNGIKVLNRVSAGNKNENLEKFKERFSERYEGQRIPLLLALDVETGIGYGQNSYSVNSTVIFDHLMINDVTKKNGGLNLSIGPFIKSLLPKIHSVVRNGELNIVLKDEDVNKHELVWDHIPPTLAVLVEIYQLNDISRISLNYCGSNASKLLSRFVDGNLEISSLVRKIIDRECDSNKDVILAEIIHLPNERTGNILRRPNYRKHEIPYLASSSVPVENQISLQDLDLQIVKNTIELYSRSRKTRVIPKLTNAHNFGMSDTPVYQFLCDIQNQNNRGFSFSWGSLRLLLDFLPRLEYRDLIISKAQWKITKDELSGLLGEELIADSKKIKSWRKVRNLPKQVVIVEGDNKLCINFSNLDSMEILISTIDKMSSIWVEEFILSPDNCLVGGDGGNYASEVIIPFYLT